MDSGIIILIVVSVIMTIIVAILLIVAQVRYSKSNDNVKANQQCADTININTLVKLDSTYNCEVDGDVGTYYYIGASGNYDYVVSELLISPLDVCLQYCASLSGVVCTGANYNSLTAQQNFDNCMSQLNPTDCIPPLPLGAIGTNLFYPYSPTNKICK